MDEFVPCAVCSRTPLLGETVTILGGEGRREVACCDLCLRRPRAAALGEPRGRERVRSTAGAENVSLLAPTPSVRPAEAQRAGSSAISLDVAANSSIPAYTR